MKRLILTLAILVALTSPAFAWTKVVQLNDGHFSVKEDSIVHYIAKGGFPATEGTYNWYSYRTKTEISSVVRIRDEDLFTIEISSCTWVNGVKQYCDAVPRVDNIRPGTNGETIMQWMVNYGRKVRGQDAM